MKRTRLNPELKNDIAWPEEVLKEVILQWFRDYRLVTHEDCRKMFSLASVSQQFRDAVYSEFGGGQITYIQNGIIERMPSCRQNLHRGLLSFDIHWGKNQYLIHQLNILEKLHLLSSQNRIPVKPTLREMVVFGNQKMAINFDANPWLVKLDLSNFSGKVGTHGLSALVNLETLIHQIPNKFENPGDAWCPFSYND